MAKKKLYQGELLKSEDWGSEITRIEEGVEVKYDAAGGTAVQNFIKNTLDRKWGYIYDNNKGKYYVFADEESCALYLEHEDDDPMPEEYAKLKLAEMNSYSNYRIVITLDTEHTMPTNAILVGQTGNKVVFVANTYDKDENPLLEGLTINYTVTRPDGSKTMVTHLTQTGKNEELSVDDYLTEGQNTVTINIVGGTSNAIANMTIVYQVINLKVSDNYDMSTVHDLSEGFSSPMSITWTLEGSSMTSKFLEWYLDGVLQEQLDPIPSGQEKGGITKNLDIDSHFSEGRHNIQYRAWLTVNEQRFYTETYSKDFIVYKGGSDPIIAISYTIPIGYEPLTGNTYLNPVLYGCVQYTGFEIPVAVYKDKNTSYVDTTVAIKYQDAGQWKTDVTTSARVSEGQIWDASLTPNVSGDTRIVVSAGNTEYEIQAPIEENQLDIHEEKAGLVLDLRATGKSNAASDRDVWEYRNGNEVYTTEFSGFTWDETSGWNNNELVISNGNSIEVKYKPLTSQVATRGLTFEIEFSTFNVSDDDAVICNIKNDGPNAAGLTITASEAIFTDNSLNKVSTKYKPNENNRIAFVVDPSTQGKPLMFIYVNGTACGAVGYSTQISSFAADKYIKISGSPYAGIRLKHIRIYSIPLEANAILNNYMLYRDTYYEMQKIYDRNDLYASAGVFDLQKISSVLPIMLITDEDEEAYNPERNNIENLMSFGTADKKTPILVRQVLYINNLDPSTSFCTEHAQFTCQGTSSMNYPIKNLRLYIKDKAKGKYGDWPLPITYTGDTNNPISLSNPHGTDVPSKAGKGKISFKSGLEGTSSAGERKPQAVNCWTLKADYAESSSSHNTGVARLWNQVMRDAILSGKAVSRTRAQAAVMSDASNRMDVRTCVDGFPCVVFYRYGMDDINWKFLGKYNFNNDKSTESVFGFCDIAGIDYQEYEYTDIDEATFNQAMIDTPSDCSAGTSDKHYINVAEMEADVRKQVGKDKPDPETGQLPELTRADYVSVFSPIPYEYSKTYQKTDIIVAEAPYMTLYEQKIMTAGNINNKNYCVEVLENESPITNFTADVSEFDDDWADGFEFRYPEIEDGVLPDASCKGGLTNLRDFYMWCHSTMNTQEAFDTSHTININGETKRDGNLVYKQPTQTYANNGTYTASNFNEFKEYMKLKFQKEKWDYLDVFKVAAYYVYLMRFGAVDQVCKNSMITSEGTISYVQSTTSVGSNVVVNYDESTGNHCKWFFINYDNDTILGLDNDGQMSYGPDIDRSTQTGNGYWVEHDHPTQEQIDECIGEYPSYDDLKRAVDTGEITPSAGDKYLIGSSVWEWYNDSAYAYAGHNSVLWNNLEADEEFMTIVRDVDEALYRAGLTYNNTVKMFNEKQANMWCERILNDDAKKKYVDQYTQEDKNHLSKMHGPRTSHRTWWLSKRFTYYDSKFVSGEYMNTKIVMKVQGENNNPKFSLQPTEFMNYGWGVTNRSLGQTGISSEKDEQGHLLPMTFDLRDGGLSTSLSMGDPIEIYASPYISTLDLSNFAANLYVLDFADMANEVLGTQLKTLILGKENVINEGANGITGIGTLKNAEKLESIDMRGMREFKNLDLSENANVKDIYAYNSGLIAIEFADGAKIERLRLPSCYGTLVLNNANYISKDNLMFENNDMTSLTTIQIKNCDLLKSTSFDLLTDWYIQKGSGSTNNVVVLEGIDWIITYADLDMLERLKNVCCDRFVLAGNIMLSDSIEGHSREETIERVSRIKALFGENCFKKEENPPVVVTCPDFIIINASATAVTATEDTKVEYSCEIYPSISNLSPVVTYEIVEDSTHHGRQGVTITPNLGGFTATLRTEELVLGATNTITIRATYNYTGSNYFTSDIDLVVKDPTYPSQTSNLVLEGPTSLKKNNEYYYDLSVFSSGTNKATGTYNVVWSFNDTTSEYIDYAHSGIVGGNQLKFKIKTSTNEPDPSADIILTAMVIPYSGHTVSKSVDLLILNDNVIMTNQSNPTVMAVCYAQGWAENPAVLTKQEALNVTDLGEAFRNLRTNFGFHEFVEFENVTSIHTSAFRNSYLTGMTIHSGVTELGASAFTNCSELRSITFNEGSRIASIPTHCFNGCTKIENLTLPSGVTEINAYAFGDTEKLTKVLLSNENMEPGVLVIPNSVNSIKNGAFEVTNEPNNTITVVELPSELGRVEDGDFDVYLVRGSKVNEFIASDDHILYSTPQGVLYNRTQQTLYKYPSGKEGTTYEASIHCLTLYEYAFSNTKLLSVSLNRSTALSEIQHHQFEDSRRLTTVSMNDCNSVREIPNYCFNGCTALQNISYPNSIEKFGSYVFKNNNSLSEIVIPNSVTVIGHHLISYCNALVTLSLPDSIVNGVNESGSMVGLGYVAHDCQNIVDIKFPKYAKVYGRLASDNPSLTGVTLPCASYYNGSSNVNVNTNYNYHYIVGTTQLGNFIEYKLPEEDNGLNYYTIDGIIYSPRGEYREISNVPKGLTSITIADGTISMANSCFDGSNIRTIEIPDSVRNLGTQDCFYNATKLETAIIGKGVTAIPVRTFQGCSSLKSVVFKSSTINTISYSAFRDCSKLSAITFSSLAVPSMVVDVNFRKGYNPFGNVVYDSGTRTPSTFTGYGVTSDKKVKVQYFEKDGVDSIELYKTTQYWDDPLFTPRDGSGTEFNSGCGFDAEYLTFAEDIYVKFLMEGGVEYDYSGVDTSLIPYAHSEDAPTPDTIGEYQADGEYAGYYRFSLGAEVVSNKPITFTMGPSGDNLGTLRPLAYDDHLYTLDKTLASAPTRGAKVLSSSKSGDETISRYDYDILVSRMNSLEMKLKNIEEN